MTKEQKLFVEYTSIDSKSFSKAAELIDSENPELIRKQFPIWDQLEDTKTYRAEIAKVRSYYNNKKNAKTGEKSLCEFSNFREFYNWYIEQPQKCYYCGTPAETLQKLFNKEHPILKTKRLRGFSLEIDRMDATTNLYSVSNCVLACYFCNNHKSDIISAEDFKKYFAPSIQEYLADKVSEVKTV